MVDNSRSATEPSARATARGGYGSPLEVAQEAATGPERLGGRDGLPLPQGASSVSPDGRGSQAAADSQSRGAYLRDLLASLVLVATVIGGGILAAVSGILIAVFVAVDLSSGWTNPYNAIVGYMLLPSMLVLGMVMVPAGVLVQRRRLRHQAGAGVSALPRFPVIDLNRPAQLRLAVLAAAGALVATGLIATAGVRGFEYGESADFCGLVCHRVMTPEYVAYQSSTHARVPCASCHIGPGASWFVKSKLTGVSQLFAYTLNTYERPIPAPIESLRPSRDTCEQCHWPDRIYGDRLQVRKSYAPDERNSLREQTIVFRVGGGNQNEGVHWHIANEVWYLALDQARQNVGWVEVRRSDGSRQEYRDPIDGAAITAEQIQAGQRRMDCVDCHNRTAHEIRSFEEAVDRAMATRSLDASIPHLKQLAMALGPQNQAHPLAEDHSAVRARLASFAEVYRRDYPSLYEERWGAVAAAGQELVRIYESTAFAEMRVDSSSYTNNLGHQQEGAGCARCHGKLALYDRGQVGERVSSRCDLCHYAPVTTSASGSLGSDLATTSKPAGASAKAAELPAVSVDRAAAEEALFGKVPADSDRPAPGPVPHAFDENQKECLACHGRQSLSPVPVSHAGRTEDSCLLCHPASAGSAGQ